jgi:hypothetical protein
MDFNQTQSPYIKNLRPSPYGQVGTFSSNLTLYGTRPTQNKAKNRKFSLKQPTPSQQYPVKNQN